MIKSGITRRIDELGRIVIPKEMRYNLGIRDGEPLEIYIENNSIVIKKYSAISNIESIATSICNIMSDTCNIDILVSDRDKIISGNNKMNSKFNIKLTENHKKLIDERISYNSSSKEDIYDINGYFYIEPIITGTDSIGLVFIISNEKNIEIKKYAKIISKLIEDKIDVS